LQILSGRSAHSRANELSLSCYLNEENLMLFNAKSALSIAAVFAVLGQAACALTSAQQVTGTPGSLIATTTIDGKQIPPPPPKFGGVIKESAKDSTSWWPPRVVPPRGAPQRAPHHLISEDHPARAIWTLVGRLNLSAFYQAIESSTEEGGRPAIDPQLLISL
jgi:hypothetical protein